MGGVLARCAALKCQADHVAGLKVQPRPGPSVTQVHFSGQGEHQDVGTATGGHATGRPLELGHDRAVCRPRAVVDLDVVPTRGARETAHQDVRDVGAQLAPVVVGA